MADNNLTTKEEFLLNPVEEHNITDAAVASFETNLKHPLKVTVPITPIQDLHGMPNPYPAGTSVNLIPDGTDTSNGYVAGNYLLVDGTIHDASANWYISEYFEVDPEVTYTWSNRLNTSEIQSICFYDENKQFISGIAINKQYSQTFVPPEGTVYCRSTQTSYDFQKLNPTSVAFQLEVGSTATAYRRYSNICPIEGYTSDIITRKGKNLYVYATNSPRHVSSRYAYPYVATNQGRFVYLKPGTYTITFYKQSGATVAVGMYRSLNGGTVGRIGDNASWSSTISRTIVSTGAWYNFYLYGTGLNSEHTFFFQIEVGSTSTSYEPYKSQAIPITFTDPSTGDPTTVYKGSLTLNEDGSADLVSDHLIWTADAEDADNWYINGNGLFSRLRPKQYIAVTTEAWWNRKYYSNILQTTTRSSSATNVKNNGFYAGDTYLVVRINSILGDLEKFREILSTTGLQISSPTNPKTYHFPNVGQLKAFLGENNVWSDIGNVNVKYLTQHSETGLEYRGDRALELRRRAMMADAPTIHTTIGSEETGGLASFKSYVKAPVKKIEIPFSPKQDLHGYDHPWPGGASINLFNPDATLDNQRTDNVGAAINGSGWCISDWISVTENTDYFMNHAIPSANGYCMCFYDANKSFLRYAGVYGGGTAVRNSGADAAYLRVTVALSSKATTIVAQSSSNVSFVPYANICPIEGYDKCTIRHAHEDIMFSPYVNTVIGASLNDATKTINSSNYFNLIVVPVPKTRLYLHKGNSQTETAFGFSNNPNLKVGDAIEYFQYFRWGTNISYDNHDYQYAYIPASKATGIPIYSVSLNGYFDSIGNGTGAVLPLIFNQSGDHSFAPIQEGSGNPSPENVRPIHPGLIITRDDDSVLSVYDGTLTVNADGSSTMVSDQFIFTVTGDEEDSQYGKGSDAQGYMQNILCSFSFTNPENSKNISNAFVVEYGAFRTMPIGTFCFYQSRAWFRLFDRAYNPTIAEIKARIKEIGPLQFVGILAEPTTYTLSVAETNRALEALGLTQHIGPLYGGTITINPDGSADVTQTIIGKQFDETSGFAWGKNPDNSIWYTSSVVFPSISNSFYIIKCDCLPNSSAAYNGGAPYCFRVLGSGRLYISLSADQTSSEDCQAWMQKYKPTVIATLTTPNIYHFSNLEQLKVWLGENNFWCDISDDITVKYWNRG